MEKTLDLEQIEVQLLDKEKLLKISGGDPTGGILFGAAAALFSIYKIGEAIGRELYYETHN
jgi:hypothetical protein